MDNLYNQKFTLSDYIWTKYTFDSISMQQDEDQIECGIRCEFSKEQCDFFTVDSGECHLGRYDHWDLGTVQSTSSPMTYHKEGIVFFQIVCPKFQHYSTFFSFYCHFRSYSMGQE